MRKPVYGIGVDGGGSRTRLVIADERGVVLARGVSGSCNLRLGASLCFQSIQNAFNEALSKAPQISSEQAIFHAAMGLAGIEDQEALNQFLQYSQHAFQRIEVVSDAEAACLGAHDGQEGAVIIAGTGIIGYQREGDWVDRVSGYGFPYDDEGSGAWLGMQACQWALRFHDGRAPASSRLIDSILEKHADVLAFLQWMYAAKPVDFAGLTGLIAEHQHEDGLAEALLKASAGHIAGIHRALLSKQRDRGIQLPCALMGGLSSLIRPYLQGEVSAALLAPKRSPEEGVLSLVLGEMVVDGG